MQEIEKIKNLYAKGRSAAEIGEELGITGSKVIHQMERHGVERRTRSEAVYRKHNVNGDPFDIRTELTEEQERLKALALGLYWGEGSKYDSASVRIANTDPALLRTFIKFLIDICRVNFQKIKIWVTIHADVSSEEAELYWSHELNIPLTQFNKTMIIASRGNGCYKKKSHYGTATVCVSNTKLRQVIQEWMNDCAHVAQSEEHKHGKFVVTGSIPVVGSIFAEGENDPENATKRSIFRTFLAEKIS